MVSTLTAGCSREGLECEAGIDQKSSAQFSQQNRSADMSLLWPPHLGQRRQRPPHAQSIGSVVLPGSCQLVAPSFGRGNWIESSRRGSGPLKKPCGCAAALPTTTPGESGTGSSASSALPVPESTTVHSSESGWVWA